MACEDFPCCGHESGCCPDFDPQTGKQLDMKCVCGASVPLDSGCSLCEGCLRQGDRDEPGFDPGPDDTEEHCEECDVFYRPGEGYEENCECEAA